MSFVMSVTLQCDFKLCEEEYSGDAGFELHEVRDEAAEMDGWVLARRPGRPLEGCHDLCPTHAGTAEAVVS